MTPTSGRLEICYNNAWGTVCNSGWESHAGQLACRQLGFPQFGKSFVLSKINYKVCVLTLAHNISPSASFISPSSPFFAGYGTGPIFLYYIDCYGSESALSQCTSTQYSSRTSCNHFDDVTLNCTGILISKVYYIIIVMHL